MKHKQKGKKESAIREIDVGALIDELSRPSEDSEIPQPGQHTCPSHVAPKKQAQPSIPNVGNDSKDRATTAAVPAPNSTVVPPSPLPASGVAPGSAGNSGGLSRSKKQLLRLQRRLLERQAGGDAGDSGSDSPSAASAQVTRPQRPKKNYVERTSSGMQSPVKSCGWKDAACVLFVLLAVVAAGFMKFQEEVFGSVDHVRLESDADADFYEILGLTHAASARDVKRAYRTKVMEVHPDQHPECLDCGKKFIATTKAYETLVDEEKRRIYDQTRGSYEPILSDFSVSLTSFNFDQLVTRSSSVWIVQVYDDLDASSKHFATQWDSVASSDLASVVKFGRVNARRDRALLSSLPMRTRTFPGVMMFSRDTMPSIFSVADVSAKALRRWIVAELPSHVGESSGWNQLAVVVSGRTESASVKAASVEFNRVLDLDFKPDMSLARSELRLVVKSKSTGAVLLESRVTDSKLVDELRATIRRITVPVNRYNFGDICGSGDVLCVVRPEGVEAKLVMIDETVVQPISAKSLPPNMVIDVPGSRTAVFHGSRLDDLVLEDLRFAHVDFVEFMNEKFPLGLLGTLKQHATALTVLCLITATVVSMTKVGLVQITIAVAFMSVIVGVLNAVPAGSLLAVLKKIISL